MPKAIPYRQPTSADQKTCQGWFLYQGMNCAHKMFLAHSTSKRTFRVYPTEKKKSKSKTNSIRKLSHCHTSLSQSSSTSRCWTVWSKNVQSAKLRFKKTILGFRIALILIKAKRFKLRRRKFAVTAYSSLSEVKSRSLMRNKNKMLYLKVTVSNWIRLTRLLAVKRNLSLGRLSRSLTYLITL